MTLLTLNTRIGQFALIAAAVAIALIAFGAPGVMEASGATQTGASTNDSWLWIFGAFGVVIEWFTSLFG